MRTRWVFLILVPTLLTGLAGCATVSTRTHGDSVLGLEVSDFVQARAELSRLADKLLREAETLEQARQIIGRQENSWSVQLAPPRGASSAATYERAEWRWALVHKTRIGLGVYATERVETHGLSLVLVALNGRVHQVEAQLSDLTERERQWATHQAISVGAAVAGSFLLLSLP